MQEKELLSCFNRAGFLLFLMAFGIHQAEGQYVLEPKRNVVHGNVSTYVLVGEYLFTYERSVVQAPKVQTFLGVGFGGWYATSFLYHNSGYSAPLTLTSLIGRRNNFFEIDLGARYMFYSERYTESRSVIPVIKLGYRYQRRDGSGLVFRTFIGLMGVGVGVGKAF